MKDIRNRGVLFKNDGKNGTETLPDYIGRINVEGTEYRLSAWIREGKSGKYLSLSVRPMTRETHGSQQTQHVRDDEIPF